MIHTRFEIYVRNDNLIYANSIHDIKEMKCLFPDDKFKTLKKFEARTKKQLLKVKSNYEQKNKVLILG